MSRLAILICALVCGRVSPFSVNSKQSSVSTENNNENDYSDKKTGNLQLIIARTPKVDIFAEESDDIDSSDEPYNEAEDRIKMDYLDALSHKSLNKNVLRDLWRGCNKKGYKSCKKACYSAYKSVCREYDCRSSMKSAFRRKCKSNCDYRFYY